MSSEFQAWNPSTSLPVELIEMIVEELLTPKALVNLACTSRLMHSIVFRKPFHLYELDARYHRRLMTDDIFRSQNKATLPSLIHIIRHDSLDKIKTVLEIFQAGSSVSLGEAWDVSTFPTPIEAAIVAGRSDVMKFLLKSGCELRIPDRHYILDIEKEHISCDSNMDLFEEDWEDQYLGIGCHRLYSRAYVLACAVHQDEIALWLVENVYYKYVYYYRDEYYLMVAAHTGNHLLAMAIAYKS
ncbi:hypothetical protein F5Y10DRAFT_272472 [Nemania abortiva]|nr:hypothetical protein F5Y10DRAFT_272472 [Nemania abortiva]